MLAWGIAPSEARELTELELEVLAETADDIRRAQSRPPPVF